MSTRLSITLLLFGLVSSVLFGVGATTVLSIPSLSAHASLLLPIVVVASFIVAPVICWVIAPMLRAQYSRQEEARRLRLERADRSPA
jgi:ABC-type sulfate transport system permease subunit